MRFSLHHIVIPIMLLIESSRIGEKLDRIEVFVSNNLTCVSEQLNKIQ